MSDTRATQSRSKKGEQKVNIGRDIEIFLRQNDMPPTKFGRLAARDPRLVFDIRLGRELRPPLAERVRTFMQRESA